MSRTLVSVVFFVDSIHVVSSILLLIFYFVTTINTVVFPVLIGCNIVGGTFSYVVRYFMLPVYQEQRLTEKILRFLRNKYPSITGEHMLHATFQDNNQHAISPIQFHGGGIKQDVCKSIFCKEQ